MKGRKQFIGKILAKNMEDFEEVEGVDDTEEEDDDLEKLPSTDDDDEDEEVSDDE